MSDSASGKHDDVPRPDRTRLRLMICGIGFLGIFVSLILSVNVLQTLQKTEVAELQSRLADLVGRIESEFNVQLASIRSFRAFLDVSKGFSPEQYDAFINDLGSTEFATLAYGWAPKRLVSPVSSGAAPDQQSSSGVISYPVGFMVPEEKGRHLLDVDLLQIPEVRRALSASIDRNEVQISLPMHWQEQTSDSLVVLAVYPQYRKGSRGFLVRQRQQDVLGIAFGILDLEKTIGFAITTSSLDALVRSNSIGIEILDDQSGETRASLFQTDNLPKLMTSTGPPFLNTTMIIERALELAQRTVHIRMAINLYGLNKSPFIAAGSVLLIGLLVTLLLSYFVHRRFDEQERVNALVAERTNALEDSEQRFRDMAEISADWFWEMDRDFRFTFLSERFEAVTGLSPDLFIGRTRAEAAGINDFELTGEWRKHFDDLQGHRPFFDFRYTIKTKAGVAEYVSISGKPVFDERGVFSGYRGSGRNVTTEEFAQQRLRDSESRLHRNVEQLETSRQYLEESTAQMAEMAERFAVEKDRAEASEKSKSEFLASMSHEIRTPMTGVMGFADLLLDSNLAPDDRDKVIKIKGATQSLLSIINDILDLSKLDAGRLKIEFLDFNLRTAIDEVLDLVRERARVKKIDLQVAYPDEKYIGMYGDPSRIRQILINLVGNAVKFTHTGSVTIQSTVSGHAPDQTIEFRVIDTGIGISKENSRGLFSDFSQADASISRQYEGTGLGLSISKRLVELMHGKIWFESEEGVGSTFFFTLPYQKARTDIVHVARQFGAQNFVTNRALNILVAEDNKLNQRIIVATLEKFGHQATVVENGEQAVQQVSRGDFDLILMDIRMPEMSGPEATRAIRSRCDDVARIPIIALTADAMEEHIRGYIAIGMNACVTKPIDRALLVQSINDVLGEEIHSPEASGSTRDTDTRATDAAPGNSPPHESVEVINVADFLMQIEAVAKKIEQENKVKP
ncbi:MAG: ATP-binding protein [Rhodospirillales bacterium]